jgi:hypothetical protein
MAPSSIAHQGNEDHTHSSMMAWRVHEFGPPDVMRFERTQRMAYDAATPAGTRS